MKNLILAFTLIFSFGILAQSTPRVPETPKTTSKNSISYSVHIDDDDDVSKNSSISVKKSDNSYKFRASFHNSKTEKLKKLIIDRLGKENLKIIGNSYTWYKNGTEDEIFECTLSKGHIRIYLSKDDVSTGFYRKIDALGEELKYAISGSNSKTHKKRDSERAQRDIERAQRDVERAQRDLERAQRVFNEQQLKKKYLKKNN